MQLYMLKRATITVYSIPYPEQIEIVKKHDPWLILSNVTEQINEIDELE